VSGRVFRLSDRLFKRSQREFVEKPSWVMRIWSQRIRWDARRPQGCFLWSLSGPTFRFRIGMAIQAHRLRNKEAECLSNLSEQCPCFRSPASQLQPPSPAKSIIRATRPRGPWAGPQRAWDNRRQVKDAAVSSIYGNHRHVAACRD